MNQQKPPKKNNGLKNAALLSGIALEMGGIIFLSAKGGKWLDDYFEMESKTFLIVLTLLGVAVAIYLVLQQLKRIKY
ncbi:AtpZ/AtpI family protein [Arenibacter sp. F26102]|uniref:AtpZ/AtpI family protein n=1 Tax=Arenibacter sp. F26102 TaxID=2926416 RepID=UPI001FF56595|nr:AtpZ/AtpI family protein [Arenibacter sp. F26102]MCK0144139.1 AtpZ/AtpI family protein [Arenibacter sp. F26102]